MRSLAPDHRMIVEVKAAYIEDKRLELRFLCKIAV
jgi:hypothetical protein